MRRIGVTAAVVVLGVLVLAVTGHAAKEDRVAHTCAATDRSFIKTATIDVSALEVYAAGYRSGELESEEVVRQARDAAKRVSHVEPRDASLRQAQNLLGPMFEEYGEAVALHAKGKDAGKRMHRAYRLANFARDVLMEAEPALAELGCDVGPLL